MALRAEVRGRREAPWRKPLLAIHIVASVGVLGADLALLALGISGAQGAEPETVYPAMSLVGAWLIAPLAVLALGTGLLQAVLRGWGLARYWWVTIKLTITAVLTERRPVRPGARVASRCGDRGRPHCRGTPRRRAACGVRDRAIRGDHPARAERDPCGLQAHVARSIAPERLRDENGATPTRVGSVDVR